MICSKPLPKQDQAEQNTDAPSTETSSNINLETKANQHIHSFKSFF